MASIDEVAVPLTDNLSSRRQLVERIKCAVDGGLVASLLRILSRHGRNRDSIMRAR
jgi:precorrin-3B methylase